MYLGLFAQLFALTREQAGAQAHKHKRNLEHKRERCSRERGIDRRRRLFTRLHPAGSPLARVTKGEPARRLLSPSS